MCVCVPKCVCVCVCVCVKERERERDSESTNSKTLKPKDNSIRFICTLTGSPSYMHTSMNRKQSNA